MGTSRQSTCKVNYELGGHLRRVVVLIASIFVPRQLFEEQLASRFLPLSSPNSHLHRLASSENAYKECHFRGVRRSHNLNYRRHAKDCSA